MKFGLLVGFSKLCCNYGDFVQSFAIERVYEQMGVPAEAIVRITKSELAGYDGEQLLLPYSYTVIQFFDFEAGKPALSKKITPVFLGLSFVELFYGITSLNLRIHRDAGSEEDWLDLFRRNAPIGCRDDFTRRFLAERGVAAYLQGCISGTLPRRADGPYRKVLLVDCPLDALRHIPDELLANAETMANLSPEPVGGFPVEEIYQRVKMHYEYIRDNAALVITSRYHVAVPCNAMGIPAILVLPEFSAYTDDFRWDTLPPQIQVGVSGSDYRGINWRPEPPEDFPALKSALIDLAAARIREAYERHVHADEIHSFFQHSINVYASRRRPGYAVLLSVNRQTASKGVFYIWGAKDILCDGDRVEIASIIQTNSPGFTFSAWIDSFRTGMLAGKPIISPDEIQLGKNDFVVVAAEAAVTDALAKFRALGLKESQYLIIAERKTADSDLEQEKLKRKDKRRAQSDLLDERVQRGAHDPPGD